MRLSVKILVCIAAFASIAVHGQGGRSAPERISFSKNTAKASINGTLRNGQQKDYFFAAEKGQTVTIANATSRVFDFRVFNAEYFDEGDFDSSPNYSFEIPETGDYLFTVRKKIAGPRAARYSMTITIK